MQGDVHAPALDIPAIIAEQAPRIAASRAIANVPWRVLGELRLLQARAADRDRTLLERAVGHTSLLAARRKARLAGFSDDFIEAWLG